MSVIIISIIGVILTALCVYYARKSYLLEKNSKIKPPEVINSENILLVEPKSTCKIYRAINENVSYFCFDTMLVNMHKEILVIRDIHVQMTNQTGNFVRQKKIILGTHLGNRANYSLGVTENLLPLALPVNAPKDVYLVFEFNDVNLEKGEPILYFNTSFSEIKIPIVVEVIG
jgi:hypothetical protein